MTDVSSRVLSRLVDPFVGQRLSGGPPPGGTSQRVDLYKINLTLLSFVIGKHGTKTFALRVWSPYS